MSSLAKHLESIRLEDGQPDWQTRRAELHNLLLSTSSSERHFIRKQLPSVSSRTGTFSDLPFELLLRVSEYLDLEDLTIARSVSHRWRVALSSSDFCDYIAKLYFRPIWECTHRSSDPQEIKEKKKDFVELLPHVASRRLRRLRGRPASVSATSYVAPAYMTPPTITNRMYCNGRIAYNEDVRSIFVKDLRTDTMTVITERNRLRLDNWLLSDQFVIAWIPTPVTLLAWRLDHPRDDPPSRIRLPCDVRHVSAYHDQVGIITAANEAMVWSIGGEIKSLDTSKALNMMNGFKVNTLALKFHPENPSHVFVMLAGIADAEKFSTVYGKFMIQEYFEGTPRGSYHFEYVGWSEVTQTFFPQIIDLEDGAIGCLFTGLVWSSGDGTFHTQVQRLPFHACGHEHPFKDKPKSYRTQVVVKFDPFARQFTALCYHTPFSVQTGKGLSWVWRDQTTYPLRIPNWAQITTRDTPYMFAATLRPCIDQSFVPVARPFVWIERQDYKIMADIIGESGAQDSTRILRADDDFLVLFGEKGYVVWCFDKDVHLPPLRALDAISEEERFYVLQH